MGHRGQERRGVFAPGPSHRGDHREVDGHRHGSRVDLGEQALEDGQCPAAAKSQEPGQQRRLGRGVGPGDAAGEDVGRARGGRVGERGEGLTADVLPRIRQRGLKRRQMFRARRELEQADGGRADGGRLVLGREQAPQRLASRPPNRRDHLFESGTRGRTVTRGPAGRDGGQERGPDAGERAGQRVAERRLDAGEHLRARAPTAAPSTVSGGSRRQTGAACRRPTPTRRRRSTRPRARRPASRRHPRPRSHGPAGSPAPCASGRTRSRDARGPPAIGNPVPGRLVAD